MNYFNCELCNEPYTVDPYFEFRKDCLPCNALIYVNVESQTVEELKIYFFREESERINYVIFKNHSDLFASLGYQATRNCVTLRTRKTKSNGPENIDLEWFDIPPRDVLLRKLHTYLTLS